MIAVLCYLGASGAHAESSDALFIAPSGKVGIGTASPGELLSLEGGSFLQNAAPGTQNTLVIQRGGVQRAAVGLSSDMTNLQFFVGPRTDESSASLSVQKDGWVTIGASHGGGLLVQGELEIVEGSATLGGGLSVDGKVGIGVRDPSELLSLEGGNIALDSPGSPTVTNNKYGNVLSLRRGGRQTAAIGLDPAQELVFTVGSSSSAATTMMTVSKGAVSIGAANGLENNQLVVGGDIRANRNLTVGGSVTVGGKVVHPSDIALKAGIRPIPGALERLQSLRGVAFRWKDAAARGDREQHGVIAQEVEEVFPELVTDHRDGMKYVDYTGLVPVLIEAVKAQQALITRQAGSLEATRAELRALSSRLAAMEAALR